MYFAFFSRLSCLCVFRFLYRLSCLFSVLLMMLIVFFEPLILMVFVSLFSLLFAPFPPLSRGLFSTIPPFWDRTISLLSALFSFLSSLATAHFSDRTSHLSLRTLNQATESASNCIPLCLTIPGPAECAKRLNNSNSNSHKLDRSTNLPRSTGHRAPHKHPSADDVRT